MPLLRRALVIGAVFAHWFAAAFALPIASPVASPLASSADPDSSVQRTDDFVPGENGLRLYVRTVTAAPSSPTRPPVILLHGARVSSVPSFDLPVPNGSLAADLARAGHTVVLMDARGYGGSTRLPEMSDPRGAHPPLVRSDAVVRDVAAVVEWVRAREDVDRVALLGWATGAHWLGAYAALYPDRVSHLVLYNTLYGGSSDHPRIGTGSALEDPERPGQFHAARFGAYRYNTAASLFGSWDRSIPSDDPADWRDPAVAAAYAEAALASDSTSRTRTPPSFRAPSGALEDSFYMALGRQFWDASLVTARVLIVASELDFWSRPADRDALARHLVHADTVRTVVLPNTTHYVHLDRPERGRTAFLNAVAGFLAEQE